jgi:hypothetical protein
VLVAPRSEPVREPEELPVVDGREHLCDGSLDDLVLQNRQADRPLPPVELGYVRPLDRSCPVRSPPKPLREVPEMFPQVLPVASPRLPVDSRGRVAPNAVVRLSQAVYVVDVVEERGEPLLPVFPGCLTYPHERSVRAGPALGPERVLLPRVSLGQTPSLHPLRRPSRGLVRGLLRYYGPVRLPMAVRHRRSSLDFPLRPGGHPLPPGGHGISRFPCETFPDVLGVFDRAGSRQGSRYRPVGCCLPRHQRRRHPGVEKFRGSIPGPPVPLPTLRRPPYGGPTHGSGSVWVATPSPCDSFRHDVSPVLTGAFRWILAHRAR